jgi:spermidine synthase
MKAWETLSTVATPEGALELRRRGAHDFLIVVGGRVLMTSVTRRSEEALATLALAQLPLAKFPHPRVMVGGLGMAFTVRAALDASPTAHVTCVELNPIVVDWCKGPLAPLTNGAAVDPRVTLEVGDVAAAIARARTGAFDAILLDLYEGPHEATQGREDPFYGPRALNATANALADGGIFGVWSEDPDPAFRGRIRSRFPDVVFHRLGDGGRRHIVYLAKNRRAPSKK